MFSGRAGSVNLMVGLDDFTSLFQPRWCQMSLNNRFWYYQVMDCDCMVLIGYTGVPAEPVPVSLKSGYCWVFLWSLEGEQSFNSSGLGCACGCLQQLSVPIPTALPLFSWPCPVQAVGTSGTCLQQGSWAVQNMSPQWLQGSCPCAGGEQKMTWMQGREGFLLRD